MAARLKSCIITLNKVDIKDCYILAGITPDHNDIEMLPKVQKVRGGTHLPDNRKLYTMVTMYYTKGRSQELMPRKTSCPCHQCRLKFDHSPLGCPLDYRSEQKKSPTDGSTVIDDYYLVEGNFCSLACVKAYILMMLSIQKSPLYLKSLTYVSLMATQMYGPGYEIPTAIPYTLQSKWGGTLSEAEYRSLSNKEYKSTLSPVNRTIHQFGSGWTIHAQIK